MHIAIYTRKSVYIENSESIETQINLCRSYFKNTKCSFEIFEDEGFSGKDTNRPAFLRMMKLCKLKKFDAVAVYKIDRIARNIIDFINIYDELEKDNVKLISITEGFDPSTPSGKIQMILLASLADMERMNIAQRVKDNMLQLARKGCWTGGPAPKGYIINKIEGKSYLELNDKELILNMFNWYIEHQSLYKVLQLMKEHYPSKAYAIRENVRNFLRSPVYAQSDSNISTYLKTKGYSIVGNENKKGYLTYGKTKGEPIAIVSKHTAVIPSELFLKVNKILDSKNEDYFKKESKTYWLSGVLKCHICNSDYVLCNSGKNTYYVCSNRLKRSNSGIDTNAVKCINNKYINALMIENKIEHMILGLKEISKSDFENMYKHKDSPDMTKDIEKKIKSKETSLNNLINKLTLIENNLAAQAITQKIDEIAQEISLLNTQLEHEKIKLLDHVSSNNIENIFKNINSFDNIKSNDRKRVILKDTFKAIIYNPADDSLKVEFL
ncbi:recombinase family protein [uncultured Clostridium sp.]|uniref:recombinase family protein n=1 Tax=uncultured Clostridium sp. TaxID=59620 RepID=UPI0025E2EEAA|nr:recombinase family protein [uncultured Clostridium sp.]